MPDIYLHVDGQQTGPYQPAQLRQLLAEGKATGETLAWYQGLNEWTTLSKVLTAFPAEGGPPPFIPPPPPQAMKKGMSTGLIVAIVIGACFVGLFVLSCLAGIALGPITNGIKKAKESMSMQQVRAIDLAMYAYAVDHNGSYPEGATSTEVFQKLIDESYVPDPSVFYMAMPGKVKPVSNKLTAENVCFDVTSGVTANSPDMTPVVFTTGFVMTYTAGAHPKKDTEAQPTFPGIAVAFKNNSASFFQPLPDGTIPIVIPATFDPGTNSYLQLKP